MYAETGRSGAAWRGRCGRRRRSALQRRALAAPVMCPKGVIDLACPVREGNAVVLELVTAAGAAGQNSMHPVAEPVGQFTVVMCQRNRPAPCAQRRGRRLEARCASASETLRSRKPSEEHGEAKLARSPRRRRRRPRRHTLVVDGIGAAVMAGRSRGTPGAVGFCRAVLFWAID